MLPRKLSFRDCPSALLPPGPPDLIIRLLSLISHSDGFGAAFARWIAIARAFASSFFETCPMAYSRPATLARRAAVDRSSGPHARSRPSFVVLASMSFKSCRARLDAPGFGVGLTFGRLAFFLGFPALGPMIAFIGNPKRAMPSALRTRRTICFALLSFGHGTIPNDVIGVNAFSARMATSLTAGNSSFSTTMPSCVRSVWRRW